MPHISERPTPTTASRLLKNIAGVERYAIEDTNRLYQRVWGNSIHFGLWENDVSSIDLAVYRCKQRIGEALSIGPSRKVFEAGSGYGETARFLARTYSCHVTASNVSEQHLLGCNALTAKAGMTAFVEGVYADYHDLPFSDALYDAYFVQEALVHAADKLRVLQEAYRVLKPGGRLVFTDQTTKTRLMNVDDCHRIAERHGSSDLYDMEDFIQLTEQSGFTILENQDWSEHMARHFAELVKCIETNYGHLARDIAPGIIDWNLDTWRFARDKAYDGSMGWTFIVAQRPQ